MSLVRGGTSQEERIAAALKTEYAPVNEHTVAGSIVFAQAYSAFLNYFDSNNIAVDDWKRFFSEDVSVHLAIAAVQDVTAYRKNVKEYLDYLNNFDNNPSDHSNDANLKDRLGFLFSCVGTLAQRLDTLKEGLHTEIALKGTLQNLIQSQLAASFQRLLSYFKADQSLSLPDQLIGNHQPGIQLLGGQTIAFSDIYAHGLSNDWIVGAGVNWVAYANSVASDSTVFGSGTSVWDRVNHIATHNLFTSVFDQFLKIFARTVNEAEQALEKTFTQWSSHAPHYALFLAFLRLFEHARSEMNTLTARHLDFYYREILQLKEQPAVPGNAHLLIELAKQATTHLVSKDELFNAGKDDKGIDAHFANDREFIANQAKVAALKSIYRCNSKHDIGISPTADQRVFASPIANSGDGLGAKLTSADQSWHAFFNKIFDKGTLSKIQMPGAEMGFAIASHYLLMAEGKRVVTLDFTTAPPADFSKHAGDLSCVFTSVKGWVEGTISAGIAGSILQVTLTGDDPPIVPYSTKIHGFGFDSSLPMVLVRIKPGANAQTYQFFQETEISAIALTVNVDGLKSLAVSNDFGPVDTSKPFQPFGATPINSSSLIIGSHELFQKECTAVWLTIDWQVNGVAFSKSAPLATLSFLSKGQWGSEETNVALFPLPPITFPIFTLQISGKKWWTYTPPSLYPLPIAIEKFNNAVHDSPDFSENAFYQTSSPNGFMRITLNGDFGHVAFRDALQSYLLKEQGAVNPVPVPATPVASLLSVHYIATQSIVLHDNGTPEEFAPRAARFFHVAPFGQAEQHPWLKIVAGPLKQFFLLPQFYFEQGVVSREYDAEFYVGISGLTPPQSLALLFQVADGTANPLSQNPRIHWSFMRGNEWTEFKDNEIEDHTNGLLNPGIITFAVPPEATNTNTILPTGMHWIRGAVASNSDGVCRVILVAAQAVETTFADRNNDPTFPAKVLPAGTISKLDVPVADVKKIVQPFATFNGRGAEQPDAFYTRISERLRHKDRAIALWDYERLVLQAFPEIYKVKCLNHTWYETGDNAKYDELAAGHVAIVTVPNQQFHNLQDPLRPFTSLGLLARIETFLTARTPCFVKLHVKNPQFEPMRVSFKVRLNDGFDVTFYTNKLAEDLTRLLSPWAFAGGINPTFGGIIYKSTLINFVEDQPAVDYVTDFKLSHTFTEFLVGGTSRETTVDDQAEVEGSTAVSILVSAETHDITPIYPSETLLPTEDCGCTA